MKFSTSYISVLNPTAILIMALLVSCQKPIKSVSDVIDTNLEATSRSADWEIFKRKKSKYNVKTIIGGNQVGNDDKILSIALPDLQKTEIYTNDTLSQIIITTKDASSTIKFESGKFFGINEIQKEAVRITPILELKENLDDFTFKDTIWKDNSVYKLVKESPREEYVFDKRSKFLIAYLSDNRYGESALIYSDYRNVDGYMLPFKEEVKIPQSGYELEITYTDIEVNPTFATDYFKADESWISLVAGQQVPEFKLPFAQNKSRFLTEDEIRGEVTLIDFWATWCKPCMEEFPKIKKAFNKYKEKGFNVVSISVDKDKNRLDYYLNKNPFPWPYSLYSKGEFKSDLARRFQLVTLPKPILIDLDGKIIAMDADLRDGGLESILRKIFENEK